MRWPTWKEHCCSSNLSQWAAPTLDHSLNAALGLRGIALVCETQIEPGEFVREAGDIVENDMVEVTV